MTKAINGGIEAMKSKKLIEAISLVSPSSYMIQMPLNFSQSVLQFWFTRFSQSKAYGEVGIQKFTVLLLHRVSSFFLSFLLFSFYFLPTTLPIFKIAPSTFPLLVFLHHHSFQPII